MIVIILIIKEHIISKYLLYPGIFKQLIFTFKNINYSTLGFIFNTYMMSLEGNTFLFCNEK